MSIAIYFRDPEIVGGQLRAARERRSEGSTEVAAAVGISAGQLGKIERGGFRLGSRKAVPADIRDAIEALFSRYGITETTVAGLGAGVSRETTSILDEVHDLGKRADEHIEMQTKLLADMRRALEQLAGRLYALEHREDDAAAEAKPPKTMKRSGQR